MSTVETNLKNIKIVLLVNAIFSLEIFFVTVMVAFYLDYIGISFKEMTYFFSLILLLKDQAKILNLIFFQIYLK